MNDNMPRRNVLAAVLAAMTLPAGSALAAIPTPGLRGDDTARLPDHAALWARMPLPFTPAEAWHLLSPATRAEILPRTPAGFRALVQFHAADVMWLEPDTYGALALRDVAKAMEALLQARLPPG